MARRNPEEVVVSVQADESSGPRHVYGWLLGAVTLAGLGLRLLSLGSDLWLDELATVIGGRNASVLGAFAGNFGFNNHLLNTIMVRAAMRVFGEHEWAVRLPAMLWGTATIPVLYWVARQMLPRHASLGAALLLAVSYHHIFFSQDARGYSGYVCLSLISSALLIKGLATDGTRAWLGFVVTSALNFAALLISGFVFASHVMVAVIALIVGRPLAGSRSRMIGRLCLVCGTSLVLGGLTYGAVLRQMFASMRPMYSNPAVGFPPLSFDLFAELARGLGAGFGPGLLLGAVPFAGLAGMGYVFLVKRHWALALALTLPCILQAAFFVVLGLNVYPRMFILALPLAILVAMEAVTTCAVGAARRLGCGVRVAQWITGGLVVVLGGASVAALPSYYRFPKQPYQASVAYVDSVRPPGSIVIGARLAAGLTYYEQRSNPGREAEYVEARTLEAFDEILAQHPDRPVWVVMTFPRALRSGTPELEARIRRDWELDRTFRGTVGDGDISVWRPNGR